MLKGLEVKTILNIKEVNIFKDEIAIHFVNVKGNYPLNITYIFKIFQHHALTYSIFCFYIFLCIK
jgi:hypothetical protein